MLALSAGDWLVSGTTVLSVLVGVFTAAWHERRNLRWERIERCTQQLTVLLPHVTVLLWERWQGERDTGVGSEWTKSQGEVTSLLTEIMVSCHRLRRLSGHARRVEMEANDLMARLVAAIMDFQQSPRRLLLDDELIGITTAGLFKAVFGNRRSLDTEIAGYRRRQIDKPASS
jgi:hypothetical protein